MMSTRNFRIELTPPGVDRPSIVFEGRTAEDARDVRKYYRKLGYTCCVVESVVRGPVTLCGRCGGELWIGLGCLNQSSRIYAQPIGGVAHRTVLAKRILQPSKLPNGGWRVCAQPDFSDNGSERLNA
jgi:hypothetical protein